MSEKMNRCPTVKNFGIKYSSKLLPGKNPVWFTSDGFKLAGNVFTPPDFKEGRVYSTLVTVNPAGAVKEQSAGFYSEKLANLGYITLAFDNRTFGESEGFPRYSEDPFMKVFDIKNAVTFMSCLDAVNEKSMGLLGLCSGAGYAAYAAAFDIRVRAVATVSGIFDFAGWIVADGELSFDEMLRTSAEARKKYYLTGEADYVDAWYGECPHAVTKEDWKKRNRLWNELTHYYREGGNRGWYKVTNGDYRSAQCIDNRYMMNVNPVLKYLGERKFLAIRGEVAETGPLSDEAVSFANRGCGELFVVRGASHTDLYHVEDKVSIAIDKLKTFYAETLD